MWPAFPKLVRYHEQQLGSADVAQARQIAAGALARQESRGGHYRSDFPETLAPHRTFIRRGSDGAPLIQHSAIAEGA